MRYWIFLGFALGLAGAFVYGQDVVDVQTWGYSGCEHTMTTNHFELAPGEDVAITLDLTGCASEDLGGLLFFGYVTTKNSSKQLTAKNRIMLSIEDDLAQQEIASSNDGSVMTQLEQAASVTLRAFNMNRRKAVKIRLRSESGL